MNRPLLRIVFHVWLPLVIGFFIYFLFRPGVWVVRWWSNRKPLWPPDQLNQLQQWLIYSGPDFCWSYSLSSILFIWEKWAGIKRGWQFPLLVFVLVAGSEIIQGWLIRGFTFDGADLVAAVLAFLLSMRLNRRKYES